MYLLTPARRRKSIFPFLNLPAELRLQIYGYALCASSTSTPKRALAKLRPLVRSTLDDGIIALRKTRGQLPRAHSKSPLPNLAILRVCRQIRNEATDEIYKHNIFEVVARTQIRGEELVFNLPGFLRLDLLRHLILVTHSEVSRFQSCFAYESFVHLSQLRKISIAMKTTNLEGGPDFHSCLESLNLVLWLRKDVVVEFAKLETLIHHDHPAWVSPKVLATYFEMFRGLRGVGLSTWTADVAVAYDQGLTIAKSFSVL